MIGFSAKFVNEIKDKRQYYADDETRDHWKIKGRVPFFKNNVAGEPPDKLPKEPHKKQNYANRHHQFAKTSHLL